MAYNLVVSNSEAALPAGDVFVMPTSPAQQRLWILDQFQTPGSATYNVPLALRLEGQLKGETLEQSLNEIVRRHEVLRTTFTIKDGQPVQVIAPELRLPLAVIDLSDLPQPEQSDQVTRLMTGAAQQPFDLTQGPLLRPTLFRLGPADHIFLLLIHHIVCDGWSMAVFTQELVTLYRAFSAGQPPLLPDLPIQYADYALWQQDWLQSEAATGQVVYWKKQLSGDLPALELPTDRPRPPVQTFRGAAHTFTIPPAILEAIKALGRQENTTLFMTLLAAFKVLLYRYTRQDDLLVGTPIANRTQAETEPLIGFFVNTLVLRSDLSGRPTFRDLLARIRQVTLATYAHQDLPFEKLVEIIQPERTTSHTPLFQVMFTLQNTPPAVLDLPGLVVTPLPVETGAAKFDLSLVLTEEQGGLSGHLRYNSDLFETATMERLAGHFNTLLAAVATAPDTPIIYLPLLTTTEQQLFRAWTNTQADYPATACIHHLFEAQVEQTPDAIAVHFGQVNMTYRDLNRRANHLAYHLQRLGVKPDGLVGLCVERSLEMVIGLLGVLKAGGAYVPLDPAYPQERLAFILADTQAAILLTQTHLRDRFAGYQGQLICLDDASANSQAPVDTNPVSTATAANLAYVIYTSGSTGQPKGVMIEHRALVNFSEMIAAHYRLTAADRVLQFASISFDASAEEIYPALTRGATLVLRSDEMLASGETFWRNCADLGLTVLDLPTAYWHQLVGGLPRLKQALPASLRLVILGGEKVMAEAVNLWLEHTRPAIRLVNSYGPTEATVVATVYEVTDKISNQNVPVGRPIGNVQAYVLDEELQPMPIGVPGQLYLGGAGLARGYLNRPELTAERFVNFQFSILDFGLAPSPVVNNSQFTIHNSRLYKTGDLARYRPDGHLEFLGRIDKQVKIRGFRIEPGEIEAVLSQHPHVSETVVIARPDESGSNRLVAYIVPSPASSPAVSELHRFLAGKLPDYMLPSAFVMLDSLPLTINDKIDHRALPAPDSARPDLAAGAVAPQNPVEEVLVEVWQEVLGVKPVGIHDNFFQLGGHSLLATQIIYRLQQNYDLDVPLRSLFESPTIAELAVVIEALLLAETEE